jgi:hypothetical protein
MTAIQRGQLAKGWRRGRAAFQMALIIAMVGEPSSYADVSSADQAAAQALFDSARRLSTQGNFPDACPKFLESQRLDPSIGTQFNLADCYEHIGRIASAWAHFLEVAGLARNLKQTDREKVARERAALLVSRLSKLTIAVSADSDVPDLEIKRDGSVVGRPSWGAAMPVDAGTYTIEAKAPGKKPWRTEIEVRGEGAEVGTTIRLEDAPPSQEAPPAPAPAAESLVSRTDGKAQRTTSFVVGGVGVVGLGIGTIFALTAKSRYDDSLTNCNPQDPNRCNASGLDQRDRARAMGNAATVTLSLGAAAVVTGAILYFTAPSAEAPRVTAALTLEPRAAGVAIAGVF